jgi:hypothetical protein
MRVTVALGITWLLAEFLEPLVAELETAAAALT